MMTGSDPINPNRSRLMSRVRQNHTGPEIAVRRLLHSAGYRFALHAKDLPGRPDIVFTRRKKVVFVHGCFWHRHHGCRRTTSPKTRSEFWQSKFDANVRRDSRQMGHLAAIGWETFVVWECEIGQKASLAERMFEFLGPSRWPSAKVQAQIYSDLLAIQ